MAQAITAPGDVILCPNPTYPIHAFGFLMAGGVIRSMSVEPDESFFPPLERAVRHSIPKPLALILNYPSNPTALCGDARFLQGRHRLRQEARHHRAVRPCLFGNLLRRRRRRRRFCRFRARWT